MERPILFSGPMVRAILDGRKTMTRRVVKKQPPDGWDRACWFRAPVMGWTYRPEPADEWHTVKCPYGQTSDRLWVRETWCDGYTGTADPYLYRATYKGGANYTWKPSIHMPRKASRITLEVVGVRVERLQEISEDDAFAEGVSDKVNPNEEDYTLSAEEVFEKLWDSINGKKHPWDSNPWVWVVEFKRV